MIDRSAAERLSERTWQEAAAWFKNDPRLLVPVASLMQHGPHLPLETDVLITTALAEGLSARHGILMAPTLPFGAARQADRSYAGAGILAHKTLHRVLNDLVAGWESQGVTDIVLLTSNGYGGNYRALVGVIASEIRVRAIDANVVDVSPVLRTPVTPERAGMVETSLLLHLAPTAVRRDRVSDSAPGASMVVDGTEPVPPPGTDGVVGRPTAGTAEKGKRIYEYLVRYLGDRLFGEVVVQA